ncbi:unnamed protein product [Fraxinus pennsylvanica]|uniref:Uncharacterized protein n=1 Tax=Fraxinus pennsylvanica TaxID=56036 RepID=A0AAD2DML3_9LAMI|nr:unnamed protein product [Fraxinus pennsylvanica]
MITIMMLQGMPPRRRRSGRVRNRYLLAHLQLQLSGSASFVNFFFIQVKAVIEQADEAHRLFSDTNPLANLINLDSASSTSKMTPEERREQQKNEKALHASSLHKSLTPMKDKLFYLGAEALLGQIL